MIKEKDLRRAERQLLALPTLKGFFDSLESAKEKKYFKRHMESYLNLYLPDCAFEISSTNRYQIVSQEATIIARKPIGKGEEIKYLCGELVDITKSEANELDRTANNFSILKFKTGPNSWTTYFVFGLVRFANSDCESNAKYTRTGSRRPFGIKIIAEKNIGIGEEITISYGPHYFGEDNIDCLCCTCEVDFKNGWRLKDRVESLDDLSAAQAVSSDQFTPNCRGPSRCLRSDLAKKAAKIRSDANRDAVSEREKGKQALANHEPVRTIRVRGDYFTSASCIGPTAQIHFDKCLSGSSGRVETHLCPICKRHRILYGYAWPKTKRECKGDNEKCVYSSALVMETERRLAEKRLARATLRREKQTGLRTGGREAKPSEMGICNKVSLD